MVAIAILLITVAGLVYVTRRSIKRMHLVPEIPVTLIESGEAESKAWWAQKRWTYNKGLIIAGGISFIAYAILGESLIRPYDDTFDITLFTIFFQGTGYLFMMVIANIFYSLGSLVETTLYRTGNPQFRERLFIFGYVTSLLLPFLIPLGVLVEYLELQG